MSESMSPSSGKHQLLKPFAGTFRAHIQMWMQPGEPFVTAGTMINTFELGETFLHQHYTGDPVDGPYPAFQGRGYWGFNTSLDAYEGFWIDNASTAMQTESGDVDPTGKTWTMLGEHIDPTSGQLIQRKTIISLANENHHSMSTYRIEEDGSEQLTMQIDYKRDGVA